MTSTNNFNVKLKRFAAYLTGIRFFNRLMRIAVIILIPRRRMGAGVVVINDQGQVLLLEHAFHGKHPWSVPGGWMNRGESPAQTAVRELKEETNLTVNLQEVIYLNGGEEYNQIDAFYLATNPQGDIKLSFEIVQAKWFHMDSLPTGMLPKTRTVVTSGMAAYRAKQL